jgi:4a-hydroxytetrahydrobiopterin dehydratase
VKLSREQAKDEVDKLGNWAQMGNAIKRRFLFEDFARAMRFVNRVAKAAERANHHPDITINYNKVLLTLTTHDEGGLTMKDFKLANKINRLAA